jgi:hypothetical protein
VKGLNNFRVSLLARVFPQLFETPPLFGRGIAKTPETTSFDQRRASSFRAQLDLYAVAQNCGNNRKVCPSDFR